VAEDTVSTTARAQENLGYTVWGIKIEGGLVDQTGETRCFTYDHGHYKVTNSQAKDARDVVDDLKSRLMLVF